MSYKALFLDRDGVINVDRGYVHTISEFEFVPGIFDLCLKAQQQGYKIVVVTNQSGIARGFYTEDDVRRLHIWMSQRFAQHNVLVSAIYYCPHHPDHGGVQYQHNCLCRKPNPGMIKRAAREGDIDLANSIMVGDKISDMQAAQSAGITNRVLVSKTLAGDSTHHATRVVSLIEHIEL
ncbi:D-glycero-beta-D-manno-heptose 1,7-bisphosphate 7-phosphatase [Catenovulum sediminis]|uniref:D,D-heptose 1,7-bisphosphate phosphatase n=1 Tax=Catenovulum sediminis TaxID=1740262 RepID=A0ABV1RG18_9ALTE|nr:D-glycero-beta-D-manno-heptose 1,7-bisphosphate 7-phosphatase [Catenovulum sediminis]